MDQRGLGRLGHHIVSRRVALGYRTRTDLANRLQFTVRTLADIENDVRRASPGTNAMLENNLGRAPGSIDTILAGGEPKELVVKLDRPSPASLSHTSANPDSGEGARAPQFWIRFGYRAHRMGLSDLLGE